MLLKSVILHGADNFVMIVPVKNFTKRIACDLSKKELGHVNYLKLNFTLSPGVKVKYKGEMVSATAEILAECFPAINGIDFIYSDGKGWTRYFSDIKTDEDNENTTVLSIDGEEDNECVLTVKAYKEDK